VLGEGLRRSCSSPGKAVSRFLASGCRGSGASCILVFASPLTSSSSSSSLPPYHSIASPAAVGDKSPTCRINHLGPAQGSRASALEPGVSGAEEGRRHGRKYSSFFFIFLYNQSFDLTNKRAPPSVIPTSFRQTNKQTNKQTNIHLAKSAFKFNSGEPTPFWSRLHRLLHLRSHLH